MIIDAHVHSYPPEVLAGPQAWGRAHGEGRWTECVATPGSRSVQGWADLPRLLSDMARAGIGQCVLQGWYWESQDSCDRHNAWHAEAIRLHPGRLRGFAAVQPAAGRRAFEAVERALDSGLCGVGEVLPQAQGFAFSDPWWRRIVALAAEKKAPITLHVTDPLMAGGPAGPATPLGDYLQLASDFPEASFILAHWGGGLPFYELNRSVCSRLSNVYYDTAASPLLYDRSIFRRVADLVGPGKILFGSDYPLLVHPRETREPGFELLLRDVAESGLTVEERARILGGNAQALLEKIVGTG